MSEPNTAHPRIADREQWLAERKTLLAATRQLDTVRAKTCSIPARPHPVQPTRRLERLARRLAATAATADLRLNRRISGRLIAPSMNSSDLTGETPCAS